MAWFDGPGDARLDHDKAIVAELAPDLHHEVQADGHMALVGDLVVKTDSGVPFRIATQIDFPDAYPEREPIARDIANRFSHEDDRHFSRGDECCLWLDVETKWRPRDPDALRIFLHELVIFFTRQLIIDAQPTKGYRGPQRAHGGAAYVDHMVERWRMPLTELPRMRKALAGEVSRNARCPCGNGNRYRKCHREQILQFRTRIDPDRLRLILRDLDRLSSRRG